MVLPSGPDVAHYFSLWQMPGSDPQSLLAAQVRLLPSTASSLLVRPTCFLPLPTFRLLLRASSEASPSPPGQPLPCVLAALPTFRLFLRAVPPSFFPFLLSPPPPFSQVHLLPSSPAALFFPSPPDVSPSSSFCLLKSTLQVHAILFLSKPYYISSHLCWFLLSFFLLTS